VNPTSVSLLNRLKSAAPDAPEWRRLHDLYVSWIGSWLRRVPGLETEADDLAQEVLVVVVRELPKFERRHDGAFRAWLRQIAVNRIRTWRKAHRNAPLAGDAIDQYLAQLADSASDLSHQWDDEHDRHVLQKLLAIVQNDFDPKTWQAFTRFALDGLPAAEVAQELAISVSQVVQAKHRVLKRLREEADGLTG
jgi:RNA polymerase sigma-70 factor (ECF subfamily)